MKPALVKFTVDLFAPSAILSPTLTTWLAKRTQFHSRRIIWPVMGLDKLLDIQPDGAKALQDFFHIRVASMMDGYDGVIDGELDQLLTHKTIDELFDMPRIVGVALNLAQPYRLNFTRAGWVDLFEVDDQIGTIQFVRQISIREIAARLTQNQAAPKI